MGLRSVRTLTLVTVMAFVVGVAAAANPGEDFAGYMENLEERRQAKERYQEQLHAHEIWRQTTWSGWATRQLQALGNHFAPFFEALAEAVAAEGDSAGSMALLILIRVLVIGAVVTAVYAFSRILNVVVGGEIVVEEEVVVIEDDDDKKTASRSKKTKQQ